MYAVYNVTDGAVFKRFSTLPASLQIGKRRVISPVAVGDEGTVNGKLYRFIDVVLVGETAPGEYYTRGSVSESFDGATTLTITRDWTPWTQAEVDAHLAQQAESADQDLAIQKVYRALFQIANEARTAGGKTALTVAQFKAWLGSL